MHNLEVVEPYILDLSHQGRNIKLQLTTTSRALRGLSGMRAPREPLTSPDTVAASIDLRSHEKLTMVEIKQADTDEQSNESKSQLRLDEPSAILPTYPITMPGRLWVFAFLESIMLNVVSLALVGYSPQKDPAKQLGLKFIQI